RFAIAWAGIEAQPRARRPFIEADVFVAKEPGPFEAGGRCRRGDRQTTQQKQAKTNAGLHNSAKFAERLRLFQGICAFTSLFLKSRVVGAATWNAAQVRGSHH